MSLARGAAPPARRLRALAPSSWRAYFLLAATLLLLGLPAHPTAAAGGGGSVAGSGGAPRKKKFEVSLEDIVIAFPADTQHLEVAKASRVWRKVRRAAGWGTPATCSLLL